MAAGQDRAGKAARPAPGDATPPHPGQGNSLDDASDEAVEYMEQGEEPGHAGRGDAG
jgi:hypothetical protein